MTKHSWMLWMAPVAVWAVYMCWLTGYQSGYDQGHTAGWDTARSAFMPSAVPLETWQTADRRGTPLDLQGARDYAQQ